MRREPMPDIVVLLPGILSSGLRKGGRDIWALSSAAGIRGLLSLGASLEQLRLVEDSPDAEDLGNHGKVSSHFAWGIERS